MSRKKKCQEKKMSRKKNVEKEKCQEKEMLRKVQDNIFDSLADGVDRSYIINITTRVNFFLKIWNFQNLMGDNSSISDLDLRGFVFPILLGNNNITRTSQEKLSKLVDLSLG